MNELTIRTAQPDDTPLILSLIRELAEYEKLADQVTADEKTLHTWLFEKQSADVLIAECEGQPIGYALYFHNFSTFLGRSGIYIEDIYIRPAYRGRGFGKQMFVHIGGLAVSEGCGRLEWACLDWNAPSIAFYRSLGADSMDGWSVYRLSGAALRELSEQKLGIGDNEK